MEPIANSDWQRNGLGIAKNVDRLLRRIDDQAAIFTAAEVDLEFLEKRGVHRAIEIIGNFVKHAAAVQCALLPSK